MTQILPKLVMKNINHSFREILAQNSNLRTKKGFWFRQGYCIQKYSRPGSISIYNKCQEFPVNSKNWHWYKLPLYSRYACMYASWNALTMLILWTILILCPNHQNLIIFNLFDRIKCLVCFRVLNVTAVTRTWCKDHWWGVVWFLAPRGK